jgi:voltage-gated potassium channel Kch
MDEIDDSEGVAARVIVIMVVAAVLMTIISVAVITTIIHNVYAATYYSIGSLFDANGQSASNFIGAALVSGSAGVFYEFIGISLLDGIAKVFIIGFLIAAFIDLLSNIDIKSKLDIITARRLKGHVIICGYSMLAERLCKDLKKDNMHFVIVEKDIQKVNLLRDLKFNVIEGDFTQSNILESASIRNARAIVFATESDFVNLLGVVTAHHITPELEIISRVRHEASISNIEKAGAGLCLVPEMVAGSELGEHVSKLLV